MIFLELIVVLLISLNYTETIDSIRDKKTVETIYSTYKVGYKSFINSFFQKSNNQDVCNFTKEEKLAICEAIFQQNYYISDLKIYSSIAAFYHLEAECEEKFITFNVMKDYSMHFLKQKMFPCYGRHNPIQTDWNKDEYMDAFYVSEGPKPNSLFIYMRQKTGHQIVYAENHRSFVNEYNLVEYIENIDIIHMLPIIITKENVTAELKLRKTMISNNNIKEIEINYFRETGILSLDSRTICGLSNTKKLQLCQKIFNKSIYSDVFAIHELAMSTNSLHCRLNRVEFKNLPYYSVIHRMYPCYASLLNPTEEILKEDNYNEIYVYYLAEGYRKNSVLLFNSDNLSNFMVEFFENVFLGVCNVTVHIQSFIKINEDVYVETIMRAENKADTLCGLSREMKLGICEAIFSQTSWMISIKTFFNKAAAFFKIPNCIEIPVTFFVNTDLNENKPIQKVLPCYTRSDPIRTNWDIDEKFDMFYISSGPEDDSLILYKKYKEIHYDYYLIYEILYDVGMENFLPTSVSEDEVNEELNLRQLVSCNSDKYDIETSVLREILGNSAEIPDTVCHIEDEKKLSLCEIVLQNCYPGILNPSIREHDFQSFECQEKIVYFDFEHEGNEAEIKVKAYPCPGNIVTRSYLFNIEKENKKLKSNDGKTEKKLGKQLDFDENLNENTSSQDLIEQNEVINDENNSSSETDNNEFCCEHHKNVKDYEPVRGIFYLSTGYRSNSVIVFTAVKEIVASSSSTLLPPSDHDDNMIKIDSFTENLNFENINNANV